jgi:uncharacterized protein (TIGR02118 family)
VHRFLALYPPPADPAAFREHYVSVHIPLVEAMPGIHNMAYSFNATVLAGEATYALVFEAEFDDRAAMQAALESPEGAKAAADLANFATGGVILLDYPVNG